MPSFFSKHPNSVGETYWQHFAVALGFALELFAAAGAALVHAFFPAYFEKTASLKITELHDRMVRSRIRIKSANGADFDDKTAETARQI